jgi:hypothetical protein
MNRLIFDITRLNIKIYWILLRRKIQLLFLVNLDFIRCNHPLFSIKRKTLDYETCLACLHRNTCHNRPLAILFMHFDSHIGEKIFIINDLMKKITKFAINLFNSTRVFFVNTLSILFQKQNKVVFICSYKCIMQNELF